MAKKLTVKKSIKISDIVHGCILGTISIIFVLLDIYVLFFEKPYGVAIPSDFYSVDSFFTYLVLFYFLYISYIVYRNSKDKYSKLAAKGAIIIVVFMTLLDILNFLFFGYDLFNDIISYYLVGVVFLLLGLYYIIMLRYLLKDFRVIPLSKIFITSAVLLAVFIWCGVISVFLNDGTVRDILINVVLFSMLGCMITFLTASSLFLYDKYKNSKNKKK